MDNKICINNDVLSILRYMLFAFTIIIISLNMIILFLFLHTKYTYERQKKELIHKIDTVISRYINNNLDRI